MTTETTETENINLNVKVPKKRDENQSIKFR